MEPLSRFESGNEDRVYEIDGADTPWGDYGYMLVNGMTSYHKPGTPLPLERTGPFVPPISFPWQNVIVTTEMKGTMINAGFMGIVFGEVFKKRIVKLDWHKWDIKAKEPVRYPAGGEPENYILGRKHSDELSKQIGELWEVVGSVVEEYERVTTENNVEFIYIPGSRKGADMFTLGHSSTVYISSRAKSWFQHYFPEWTSFKDVKVKAP